MSIVTQKKTSIEHILPRHIKGFYKYQLNTKSDLNEVINSILGGVHENIYHLSHNTWTPIEISIAYNDNLFSKISYLIFKPDRNSECFEFLDIKNSIKTKYLNYEIYHFIKHTKDKTDWIDQIMNNIT